MANLEQRLRTKYRQEKNPEKFEDIKKKTKSIQNIATDLKNHLMQGEHEEANIDALELLDLVQEVLDEEVEDSSDQVSEKLEQAITSSRFFEDAEPAMESGEKTIKQEVMSEQEVQVLLTKVIEQMVQDRGVNRDSAENIVRSSEGRDIVKRMHQNGRSVSEIIDELLRDAPPRVFESTSLERAFVDNPEPAMESGGKKDYLDKAREEFEKHHGRSAKKKDEVLQKSSVRSVWQKAIEEVGGERDMLEGIFQSLSGEKLVNILLDVDRNIGLSDDLKERLDELKNLARL